MAGVVVRPATRADADLVTKLIVDTPGGLAEIVGSRQSALRIVRRAFVSSRSFFGYSQTLVADEAGTVVGEMVRLPGSRWKRLRLATGMVMLLATRPGEAWRLAWRGSVADRATAPIGSDVLYVASLSVSPHRRRRGIGSLLLAKAVEEAGVARLRAVALDVAAGNEDAIRFYRREGFALVLERRHPKERGLPAGGSIRMERPAPG